MTGVQTCALPISLFGLDFSTASLLGFPVTICMRFQDLFHSPPGVLFAFPSRYLFTIGRLRVSPPGVLFAFPSRYWFTIGRLRVFSLGGWSPHVQTGFLVPRPTHLSSIKRFRIRDSRPLWSAFPDRFATSISTFGLLPVRSSLLGESRLISFPPGTEIFQFPGFASSSYVFTAGYRLSGGFPHSDIVS